MRRRAAGAAAVVLAACVVAFAFPMYTGAVIPGQRGGREALPPARVAVPASWYDAGRWLDDAPLPGSVMVLPLSEYYQRGTTWGYYGVDDLLWRITDRRALYVLPGGYYEPAGSSPELMAALQDAVAVGDRVGTTRLMDALGVSYLAIRTDFRRTPGRTFADGRALVDAADGNTALRLDRAFEYVHMYSARGASAAERGTDRGTVSTTATRLDVASGTSADRLADIIAATPPGTEIVPDDGQPGTATAWKPTSGVASRSFPTEAGDHLVSARARSAPVWQATRTRHGEMTTVSVELASTLSLDGRPVIHAVPVVLEAGVAPAALDVGGQLVTLADSPVFFEADSGATVRLLGSGETTKLSSGSAELGNCNNARHVGLDEAGIRSEPLPGGASLMAASGSACLSFPAPTPTEISASPLGAPVWHVHAEYERTAGAATRVCLWLPRANACAVGNPPGIGARSGIIDFVAAPGHGDDPTGASLVLYSDHQDGIDDRPSAVTFHDVSVGALTTVGTTGALPRIDTTGEVRDLPGGTTTFTANARLTADLLGRVDPTVSDCHDYDDASDAENALSARALPGGRGRGVELSARRHSACVSGAVQVAPGIRHITIAFQHRNVAGSGGRWCLMGRDDTCAVSGALPASDSWRWFTKDVTLPAFDPFDRAASGSYRLYLYSDGAGPGITPGPATVTDYREVSVRNTYPIVAIAQPVRQPTGQATIRLDEGYAPEWSVSGLPAGVTARHEVVDGWANAWVVDGLAGRRARVTFHYWPDRIVGIAVWSLVPVLAAAAFSLFRHRRRRSPIDLTGSAA
ncbi:MAG: hypothetical protein U0Q22_17050 [Acidimicrobiales bacterium]